LLINLDIFVASPLDQLKLVFEAEHHFAAGGRFAQLAHSIRAYSLGSDRVNRFSAFSAFSQFVDFSDLG